MTGYRGFRLLFVLLVCCLPARYAGSEENQVLMLSIPRLSLEPGERVSRFEMRLKAAAIHGITPIPVGWTISIDNDASWNTSIAGSIQVGAAALDAAFFRNFLTVRKNEFGDVTFSVSGEISVTRDFVNERSISLVNEDFEARPLARSQ